MDNDISPPAGAEHEIYDIKDIASLSSASLPGINLDDIITTSMSSLTTSQISPLTTLQIAALGGTGGSTISVNGSSGSFYTSNGTSNSYTWSNTNPYVTIGSTGSTGSGLHVSSDAVFEGDIKWKGRSLGNLLESIESRLAILSEPDPKKLEKFTALKKAYDNYKLLEKLIGDDYNDEPKS